MVCKACGATIAEKAIVCYRCGTPTSTPVAPVRPPAPALTARRVMLAALVLLALAAIVVLAAEGVGSTWGKLALADLALVAVVGLALFGPRRR
jgi:hypothetical protein